MTVWVVFDDDPCQSTILGVYATPEAFQAAYPAEWHLLDDEDMNRPSWWAHDVLTGHGTKMDLQAYQFKVLALQEQRL